MDAQRGAVWACVVCYRADPDAIGALVAALRPQVERVVLVDNSPGDPVLPALQDEGVHYEAMPRNAGTAGAMNRAWQLALDQGAGFMVSFDQDSHPGPTLVRELLDCLRNPQLAALGPAWVDARTGRPMRILLPVRGWRRHASAHAQGLVECDHLITSGCLIPADVFRAVGPFDENLFLDYVDIEWSLRARAAGYAVAVNTASRMTHAIGDDVRVLFGRQLAVHKPLRSYLVVRNHLLLWRKPFIPRAWLVSDLVQVTLKMLALLVLAPQRKERMRAIASAIRNRHAPPPLPVGGEGWGEGAREDGASR